MSMKRLCDCCGKAIAEDDFRIFNLSPSKALREFGTESISSFNISNQELCHKCTKELYGYYQIMRVKKQGKFLKRVCLVCGRKDDDNLICPVCNSNCWIIEEGE